MKRRIAVSTAVALIFLPQVALSFPPNECCLARLDVCFLQAQLDNSDCRGQCFLIRPDQLGLCEEIPATLACKIALLRYVQCEHHCVEELAQDQRVCLHEFQQCAGNKCFNTPTATATVTRTKTPATLGTPTASATPTETPPRG